MKLLILFLVMTMNVVHAQVPSVDTIKDAQFKETIESLRVEMKRDEFPPYEEWNECVEDAKGDLGEARASIYCSNKLNPEV